MDAPSVPVANPKRESLGLLAYLVIYAVLLIGIWLGSIKHAIPVGPTQELAVLAYKLWIHIGIPAGIILLLGGALRPLFDSGHRRRGFWPTLIVLSALMFALLAVVSPALKQIGDLGLSPFEAVGWVFASWAWLSIEAG